eukprot:CAMPEP_0113308818 /NCGR_PEP_ID=MMETSP0010_2-20120614/7116_1 /TAXON_ID=216773 ORGANISM="Corethron hystrix, Strain 308" /NCGR_SAMPLE_ID=MMETSP0010_2 /ASSEMBLY_ACC=CAM_ASM_000155 /LENGTH=293 /DNA_ID=CAMNT_0000163959 /DNA_START=93 /DNA_END=974 /DNA_ORIENTATION=+ /assembly_acc=CAM_ASM_000155
MPANTSPEGYLRMAIPKKGRLYEKCSKILDGAGIEYKREARLDVAVCDDLGISLIFLPAGDIAKYVGEGNVDMGITGEDVVMESCVDVVTEMKLGFGKCRLCVQAQTVKNIKDASELAGGRIVTSFTNIASKYFKKFDEEKGVETKIKFVGGSVEAACGLGLADGIVDLVETGTTMRAAGLEVISTILTTEACLISNPHTPYKEKIELIKRRVDGYITSTKFVMISYNVEAHLLDAAVAITPGKRSPTIQSLLDGSKSVASLIPQKDVAKKMDALHDIGATDILIIEIKNSRM